MTRRREPKALPVGGFPGTGIEIALNYVSSNVLSGRDAGRPPNNGHADLPVFAGQLQLEAAEIFHLGESL